MSKQTEELKMALNKAFQLGQRYWSWADSEYSSHWKKADAAKAEFDQLVQDTINAALAEHPAQDNTYGYAKSLAEAIFKQHYASDEHYASGRIVWGVNDTVIGILTQIDNMVADMVRGAEQPAQQEPVACVHKTYSVDTATGKGNCLACGAEGEMRFIVDTTPQPAQQEPVAWPHKWGCRANAFGECNMGCTTPQAQPAREPLTDEQMADFLGCRYHTMTESELEFFRLGEAAHGIKGDA